MLLLRRFFDTKKDFHKGLRRLLARRTRYRGHVASFFATDVLKGRPLFETRDMDGMATRSRHANVATMAVIVFGSRFGETIDVVVLWGWCQQWLEAYHAVVATAAAVLIAGGCHGVLMLSLRIL